MNKVKAIGAGFDLTQSSCSLLKPKTFEWTSDEGEFTVWIDCGIPQALSTDKKGIEVAWLCESRAIVSSVYELLMNTNIHDRFDLILLSDRKYIKRANKFHNTNKYKFCSAGSNLPWMSKEKWGIYPKTKNISMVASSKNTTEGHKARHQVAHVYGDKLDIYGTILGGTFLDPGDLSTSWHNKSKALIDYRFSIVIENDRYSDYYTEKITDCFATGVIPVYWGSPQIGDIFNSRGIITANSGINIDDMGAPLYNWLINGVRDNYERVKELESADDQLYRIVDYFLINNI